MRNKGKQEKMADDEKPAKIVREAEEIRHLIEKKKIQNNILKKLIGNIPKIPDSSSKSSKH